MILSSITPYCYTVPVNVHLKAARTCVEIHLIVYDKICQTATIYVSSIILIDIKR